MKNVITFSVIFLIVGLLVGYLAGYLIFNNQIGKPLTKLDSLEEKNTEARFTVNVTDTGGDVNDCRDYLQTHYENRASWQHFSYECTLFSVKKNYTGNTAGDYTWEADCLCKFYPNE